MHLIPILYGTIVVLSSYWLMLVIDNKDQVFHDDIMYFAWYMDMHLSAMKPIVRLGWKNDKQRGNPVIKPTKSPMSPN